jgi:hypothetical protein
MVDIAELLPEALAFAVEFGMDLRESVSGLST